MPRQKYIVRNNVAILDEHTLRDEDGNVVVDFTPAKLEQIAEKNNKRIKATGDLIPLVIGHTKDGAPENTQPEIVGYAKDLRVGKFKKTGKKAIHAKFLFFKDKVHKARNFPRRSIELWLSDGKIDPISLLGATTPERDLGLLQLEKSGAVIQFAAGGRRKYKRLLDAEPQGEKPEPMDEKAIVAAVMKALEQSAVWKWAESKMKEEESQPDLEEELPAGEEIPGEEEELPEEPELPEEEEEDLEDEPEDDAGGEEPVRYNAGAACPSGMNTSTPSFGARNKNPSTMKKTKPGTTSPTARLSRTTARPASRGGSQVLQFQKQVRSLARENQELRLQFQRSQREKDLMALAAQGYEFDPEEELAYCEQLPADHYAYHLNRIKLRYQKAPVGDPTFDLSMARSPTQQAPGGGRTRDQARQIAEYATRHGISYEDALAKFDGEATF